MTGVVPIQVNQGASYTRVYTWKIDGTPVNLAGYTAEMRIGSDPYHPDGTDYLTLTQNNGLTLGGSSGQIAVLISSLQTKAFDFCDAYYQLDAIDPSGVSTRLARGNVTVIPTVP